VTLPVFAHRVTGQRVNNHSYLAVAYGIAPFACILLLSLYLRYISTRRGNKGRKTVKELQMEVDDEEARIPLEERKKDAALKNFKARISSAFLKRR
jgi:hypothetical protein